MSMDRSRTIRSLFELIAATGGAFVFISTALGLPAVYLRMHQFNLPSHLITYRDAIYAGAAPAAFFLICGLYIYWAKLVEQREEKSTRKQFVLSVVAPLGLIGMTSVLVLSGLGLLGLLSLLFVAFWYIIDLFVLGANLIADLSIGNQLHRY